MLIEVRVYGWTRIGKHIILLPHYEKQMAFLKAVLGFFLGMLFFAASIVCQAIFVNRAFLSVEDAGLDEETLFGYKRKVICLAQKSIGLTIAFIGFCAPMLLVGANLGLETGSMLTWGAVGDAVEVAGEDSGAGTYYDQNGNEISEEEALTRRLEDRNGIECLAVVLVYLRKRAR